MLGLWIGWKCGRRSGVSSCKSSKIKRGESAEKGCRRDGACVFGTGV